MPVDYEVVPPPASALNVSGIGCRKFSQPSPWTQAW